MELEGLPTYYDMILLAIVISLLGGVLLGVRSGYSFQFGILLGSLVATIFVYDALFRNPPETRVSNRTTAVGIIWHIYLLTLAAMTVP